MYTDEATPRLAYKTAKYADSFTTPVSFSARLLALDYNFVFWADFIPNDNAGANESEIRNNDYIYTTNGEQGQGLQAITIAADRAAGTDVADAYYCVEEMDLTGGSVSKREIKLRRPFGKIRLVATDQWDGLLQDNEPKLAKVAYSADLMVPNGFNALTKEALGTSIDAGNYVFSVSERADVKVGDGTVSAYILGIDYIFASQDRNVFNFDVFTHDANGAQIGYREISNVPVAENKLTTVMGNFFTNEGTIEVLVDDEFEVPGIDHNVLYDELFNAASNGGTVTLTSDLELDRTLSVAAGKEMVLNLNGHKLINVMPDITAIDVFGHIEINGDESSLIDGGRGGNNVAVCSRPGSEVTINGGVFTVGPDAENAGNSCVYSTGGRVVINGGTFSTEASWNGVYFVLNLQDNSEGKIEVKGGNFINFNPADTRTEPGGGTDFVATGYASLKVSDNPVTYSVYQIDTVTDTQDLADAMQRISDNGGVLVIDSGADIALGEETGALVINKPSRITVNGNLSSDKESVYIINNSTLTIDGTGQVSMYRRVVENHGELVVNGGTYSTQDRTGGTAIWNNDDNAVATLNDVTVNASSFAVAGNGEFRINGGTISSISTSSYDGKNWSYCIRAQGGGKMYIKDAAVRGIQGCIASIEGSYVRVENVDVQARNTPGKTDAFYALYAATLAQIEVISGDFYSDRIPCAYASDDDLAGAPFGSFILKGGRYSSYPKGANSGEWQPESGYKYTETGDHMYPIGIVAE